MSLYNLPSTASSSSSLSSTTSSSSSSSSSRRFSLPSTTTSSSCYSPSSATTLGAPRSDIFHRVHSTFPGRHSGEGSGRAYSWLVTSTPQKSCASQTHRV
ncbi:hypothetical protein BDZ89DRAFT_1060319, partial [Hymenopellis radicata]